VTKTEGSAKLLPMHSALKNSLSRVEGPEPVRGGNRLGFSVVAQERAKAARPGGSPEPKNQARVLRRRELRGWAGILFGIQSEAFSPAWENIS